MRIILIVAILLISACATPQQKAQQLVVMHGTKCTTIGFTPRTKEWANCILQSEDSRRAAILGMYGIMQQNRRRTTNCTGFGNTLNCTTY